jgi:tRNA(Leu) C34 or U34 (ribose-2'-O)-methylase TrmL
VAIATPAVVMIDPKFPHNVGAAIRAASCWGVRQV